MGKLKFAMVVNRENGRYWAWFPEIPGCATEGDTLDELRANAREAVSGCLSVLRADGKEIPEGIEDGTLETFEIENDPAEWAKGSLMAKPMKAV